MDATEELIPLLEGLNADNSFEDRIKLLHHMREVMGEKYEELLEGFYQRLFGFGHR